VRRSRYVWGIDQARTPSRESAAELAEWQPAHGVVSLYAEIDPADRGGGWRIAVRNGLSAARDAAAEGDRDVRLALDATVRRVEETVLGENGEPPGRGVIGFVEVSPNGGQERWYATQIPPAETEVRYGPRPQVAPLISILDHGVPLGVVAISAERVRLIEWSLGRAEELESWEFEYFGGDWRERKAPAPSDPGSAQGVSSAGHDQYDQRMEANRERFAHETGELARGPARERAWRELLVFGDERYLRPFERGFSEECGVRHVDSSDLISQPTGQIEERLGGLIPSLRRDRQQALVERAKDAIYAADGKGAAGSQETLQALEQGRVEHLIYDERIDEDEIERMVQLALATSAAITPIESEVADALAEQQGVAALLRY
jgi:hypothetical protein